MMQAVDGKSTQTEGYYFADKNAKTAFSSYHIMAERQTGKKLMCIRTDGGGEFCNELWDSYCRKFGIVHETTSPYSSQSNGVVDLKDFIPSARRPDTTPFEGLIFPTYILLDVLHMQRFLWRLMEGSYHRVPSNAS